MNNLPKGPCANARAGSRFARSLNPEQNEYSIDISGETSAMGESASIGSGKSQEMIIRKEVTMMIDYKRRGKHAHSGSVVFDG